MSNNKLKIRIQIQQPQPQAIDEIYPEPEIVYEQVLDWKKIAVAVLLLLSIFVLIGYLFFGGKKEEDPVNAAIPSDYSGAVALQDAILSEKIEAEPDTPDSLAGIQTDPATVQQKIHSGASESNPADSKSKAIVIPAKKPQSAALVNQSRISDKIPSTATLSKPQKIADRPEVIRAQLSRAIVAREPVDSIDAVQLRPGETRAIHFYVHLKNLQGKNVRIYWYHDNKLDSQLRLQVHNNNWRTHASKQLDSRRLGTWRVELIDESGNRLAIRNFTVMPL